MSQRPPVPSSSRQPSLSNVKKDDDANRTKILVLGTRKAGKTSCIRTIFQGLPPKDTVFLETTTRVQKINYDSIIPLQFWDTPASFELENLDVPLSQFSTIVFVLDIQQDNYYEPIAKLVPTLLKAYAQNQNLNFEVFAHKAEMLSEDYRQENFREIQNRTAEELDDFPLLSLLSPTPDSTTTVSLSDPDREAAFLHGLQSQLSFHLTSVHDSSGWEAWSKVVQRSMGMLATVEALLNNFVATSGMDKTFLFDIHSRIYVATDGSPIEQSTFDLCSDYLEKLLQFRALYKNIKPSRPTKSRTTTNSSLSVPIGDLTISNGKPAGAVEETEDDDGIGPEDEEDPDAPWVTQSTRLLPNTTIAYWEFTPRLALVALLRSDTFRTRAGMIEYNLTFLRQGVRQILDAIRR